jgi:hypothetical protein
MEQNPAALTKKPASFQPCSAPVSVLNGDTLDDFRTGHLPGQPRFEETKFGHRGIPWSVATDVKRL